MLGRKFRLTYQFFNSNKFPAGIYRSLFFDGFFKPNTIGNLRVVIVIPKKADKRAVYRNRTKRLMSEMIKKNINLTDMDFDLMFKLKKILSTENVPDATKDLIGFIKQLKSR